MYEIKAKNVYFAGVIGNNANVKRGSKSIKIPSNKEIKISEGESRVNLLDEDTILVGEGTFIVIMDQTQYPDPYTTLVALPNSEFKIGITKWEYTDKKKDEHTIGFKLSKIELIKGIFKVDSGSEIKIPYVNIIFNKKGSIKTEITNNKVYLGGKDAKFTSSLAKKPLNLSIYSEYIITNSKIYKKSLLSSKDESRMDERFSLIDTLLMKIYSGIMSIEEYKDTKEMYTAMDKNAVQFNPEDIASSFEKAMNIEVTEDMCKMAGMTKEQAKQAMENFAHFKKTIDPKQLETAKESLKKIKKEDIVKMNESAKKISSSAPKKEEILKELKELPPYSPLPSNSDNVEEDEIENV